MSTKKNILDAAKKLFASKGYEGTSVRDICDKAGVALSAINYHFGGKGELYRSLIESFGTDYVKITSSMLSEVKTADELKLRLELFIDTLVVSLMKDPELYRLVNQEVENPNSILNKDFMDTFRGTFLKIFDSVISFIEKAKTCDLVSSEIESDICASIILNQVTKAVKSDDLKKKYYEKTLEDPSYRKKWISQNLKIITMGIVKKG